MRGWSRSVKVRPRPEAPLHQALARQPEQQELDDRKADFTRRESRRVSGAPLVRAWRSRCRIQRTDQAGQGHRTALSTVTARVVAAPRRGCRRRRSRGSRGRGSPLSGFGASRLRSAGVGARAADRGQRDRLREGGPGSRPAATATGSRTPRAGRRCGQEGGSAASTPVRVDEAAAHARQARRALAPPA